MTANKTSRGGAWTPTLWPLAELARDLDVLRDEAMRVLRHEQTEIQAVSSVLHCG